MFINMYTWSECVVLDRHLLLFTTPLGYSPHTHITPGMYFEGSTRNLLSHARASYAAHRVVIIEDDQLAETEVPCQRTSLRAHTLLEAAVAAEDVREVVDHLLISSDRWQGRRKMEKEEKKHTNIRYICNVNLSRESSASEHAYAR